MKNVYVFLAEGFEEIEALTVVDLLRRAELSVKMAGISGAGRVTGSHGICVEADISIDEVSLEETAMLVLPGGMPGTKHLGACEKLTALLKKADEQKIRIGAICAAPSVLGDLGLLNGKKAVCYPGFEERLAGAEVLREPVVTDGHITTGRGMGAAIPFGLEMISCLKSEEESGRIGEAIIFRR
ncbi:MAG: DJ-1/PfpI family protein [Lachnospiraceae bacterium]|nr:DJ-1/PfpI family protein [Lachnospiraceae bacterium]